jgi:hypothetical protein
VIEEIVGHVKALRKLNGHKKVRDRRNGLKNQLPQSRPNDLLKLEGVPERVRRFEPGPAFYSGEVMESVIGPLGFVNSREWVSESGEFDPQERLIRIHLDPDRFNRKRRSSAGMRRNSHQIGENGASP